MVSRMATAAARPGLRNEEGGRWRATLLLPTAQHARIALVALGGVVLTLRTSLHDQLNGRLVLGWVITLVGLVVVLAGLRPTTRVPDRLAPPLAAFLVALAAAGGAIAVTQVVSTLTADQAVLGCRDDVALASSAGGRLLRGGARPYSAYDAVVETARCGLPPGGTVVRRGVFANDLLLPSDARIQAAFARARNDPSAPEVERRLSYPGGAVIAGLPGERGVSLAILAALALGIGLAVRRAPRTLRAVTLMGLLAQLAAWTLIPDGHSDGIAAGLLVGAWASPTTWLGGLLLGLACGTKQTAWFLAPALLATAWARGGRGAALTVAAAGAGGFLLLNGWFVATEPAAWFGGILSPALDGLFPLGAGLVGLVTSGLLPATLLPLFTVAMYTVVAASAGLARWADRALPGVGAVVGVMALWVGPRSLLEYMAPAGLLAVTVAATGVRPARRGREAGSAAAAVAG